VTPERKERRGRNIAGPMDKSLQINYLVNSFDTDVLAEDVRREPKTCGQETATRQNFLFREVFISGEKDRRQHL
jgi:hypothetical protein